jgi:hypothetical protein
MVLLRRAFVLGIIGLAAMGGRAEAGDRELARQRYQTGTMLFQRGRYADALVELERGKQADPKPEFDYNIGLCLEKLGRAAEAADAYQRFLAARPQDREAQAVRAEVARLRQLEVQSSPSLPAPTPPPPAPSSAAPSSAAPSPLPSPPAPSPAPSAAIVPPPTGSLSLPSQPYGAPTSAEPAFDAAPRPASFIRSSRGKATLAIAAIGAAALVTSAITGGLALGDRDRYRAGCAAGRCDDPGYDGGRRLAIATDVVLGLGVAAAVTATALGLSGLRRRTFALAPSAGAHAAGVAVAGAF